MSSLLLTTYSVNAQKQLSVTSVHRLHDEYSIKESIFRYQLKSWRMGAAVYCLQFGDADPPDEFMKRFQAIEPKARKVSQCKVSFGVEERGTGKSGVLLHVNGIHWLSDTVAEVEGGCFVSGIGASENIYRLAKQHETWRVVRDKVTGIS